MARKELTFMEAVQEAKRGNKPYLMIIISIYVAVYRYNFCMSQFDNFLYCWGR
jgi:hypothetical protein